MTILSALRSTSTTLSAVHRGLAFEKRSLSLLEQCLSMSLTHVGGKSDGGVDLQGWWWVPTSDTNSVVVSRNGDIPGSHMPRKRIRVFAQCKAEKKKLGPHYVREMEGVLHRHWHRFSPSRVDSAAGAGAASDVNIVGVVISQSAFTKSAILQATSSAVPFILLHIPALPSEDPEANAPHDRDSHSDWDSRSNSKIFQNANRGPNVDANSQFGSILLNKALTGPSGPLAGEIEARWEWSSSLSVGRPGLWYAGKRIPSWVPKVDSQDLFQD